MTEGIFAGAKVGPDGVTADPAKLTAIINWKQPTDALNLSSFLGITGHFRDLIRGYVKIEGPLLDLTKEVNIPPKCSKSVWQRTMDN